MSARDAGTGVRRVPAIVVIVALGAGLVALSRTASGPAEHRAAGAVVVDGPTVPPGSAIDSTWYCAEGTSTVDGRATETIIVGSLAAQPIDVTVTVMPGGFVAPKSQHLRVEAFGQERLAVSDILEATEPGVVVEIFGGPAVVEHELTGRGDVAVGPCSRQASADWYFAGGTTVRGAEDWLALFNPYGDDAIVDVSFLTDSGFQAPGATQAVTVPRRSRISLAIHEQLLRQERVAIAVHARTGRVVAERTSRFDGTDARSGIAVSLGATGPALRWRIPYGDAEPGAAESLSIANFDVVPTKVAIEVLLDGAAALEPQTVEVPARGVVAVDLASRVPAGTGYAVDVRVTRHSPVVVEAIGAWATPAPVVGVASSTASATSAPRWAFAVGRLSTVGNTLLTAMNVSGHRITVRLYAYTAGRTSRTTVASQSVGAGERAVFSLADRYVTPEQVLVVAASGPVVAGRLVFASGASLAAGVPFAGG